MSRIELHIAPDGAITRAAADLTTRLNPDGTVDTAIADVRCARLGTHYSCIGRNPFEGFAPPIVFTVSFERGRVILFGTRFPSFEVWRYDSSGARPLIHSDATRSPLGAIGLFFFGALGAAEAK